MDQLLHRLSCKDYNQLVNLPITSKQEALAALETGQVIELPFYTFPLESVEASHLFSQIMLDGKHKNLSFDCATQRLGGMSQNLKAALLVPLLKSFMSRYVDFARRLLQTILPAYEPYLSAGRTSYRPAEIKGRLSSKRKDDTRLHVDAFPASPVNGKRILRVFTNINPYGEPRIWHLGEPFAQVLQRFAHTIPPYNSQLARLLKLIKATKSLRSAYDHYQLYLHDKMKLNDEYQQMVVKQRIDFKAGSSWIVFTDQVSHAALSGRYLLEQTFYLPVAAMLSPERSPLSCWEKLTACVTDI